MADIGDLKSLAQSRAYGFDPRLRHQAKTMPNEKILVIKHGALGDFVNAMGKMRAIRDRHPHASLTLITQRFLVGLAQGTGWFDEIVVDDRGYSPASWWRIIKRTLADRRFDAIYDLQSNNRTLVRYRLLALWGTSNPMRWGRVRKNGFDFYVTPAKIPFLPRFSRIEHVDMAFPKVDLSGIHGKGENFGLLPERYALLIPGCSAGNEQKRWPPDRFRRLSEWLGARVVKSVVLGTKAEAAEISAVCDGNPHAVNFMGKSEIADIPQIAARAVLVVGNDTGPSHIARRMNVPTILLFTEYDASRAAPKNASNVVSLVGRGIADIPYEKVEKTAEEVLAK